MFNSVIDSKLKNIAEKYDISQDVANFSFLVVGFGTKYYPESFKKDIRDENIKLHKENHTKVLNLITTLAFCDEHKINYLHLVLVLAELTKSKLSIDNFNIIMERNSKELTRICKVDKKENTMPYLDWNFLRKQGILLSDVEKALVVVKEQVQLEKKKG